MIAKYIVVVATLSLVVISSAIKHKSSPVPTGIPNQSDIPTIAQGPVNQAVTDITDQNFNSLKVTNAGVENGQGYNGTDVEFSGTNDQGKPFTLDYVQLQSQTPGNDSDLEYINLQGQDAQGNPFDVEAILVSAQDSEGNAQLTAINVTGNYQGQPFDVVYAQLQGTSDGESLDFELADVEGTDPQGEQYNLIVTDLDYVSADGEVTDSESQTITYQPKSKSGKRVRLLGTVVQLLAGI